MSTWNDENRWYARLMKLAHELAMTGRGEEAQDLRVAATHARNYRWLRDHSSPERCLYYLCSDRTQARFNEKEKRAREREAKKRETHRRPVSNPETRVGGFDFFFPLSRSLFLLSAHVCPAPTKTTRARASVLLLLLLSCVFDHVRMQS